MCCTELNQQHWARPNNTCGIGFVVDQIYSVNRTWLLFHLYCKVPDICKYLIIGYRTLLPQKCAMTSLLKQDMLTLQLGI